MGRLSGSVDRRVAVIFSGSRLWGTSKVASYGSHLGQLDCLSPGFSVAGSMDRIDGIDR